MILITTKTTPECLSYAKLDVIRKPYESFTGSKEDVVQLLMGMHISGCNDVDMQNADLSGSTPTGEQ